MPWPLASSYSAVLQNPAVAFKDESLRRATIQRDKNNQPLGMSGQFAVVYQAQLSDGRKLAVRAFTSDRGRERGERYHIVREYLRQHTKVRCLLDFEYHDKGIRAADGKMYPLVTMEWVSGLVLFEWVRTKCLNHDAQSLTRAAERWVDLLQELADAQMAHGDLQHANVMVTERDEFKLVDYDGLCVPVLVGRPNMEIGVEPYQHPDRNADTPLSLDQDNFSAIFIFLALRALAAAPQLWDQVIEKNRYDKLLFQRNDFLDPGRSYLYQQLVRSPDQEVALLTRDLFELHRGSLTSVPSLKQLLSSCRVRSLSGRRIEDRVPSPVQPSRPRGEALRQWPRPTDFNMVLQDPKHAFRDEALREAKIATDAYRLPRPCSGEFATVYRATRPDGTSLAVRVFNTAGVDRQERYLKVAEYLQTHPLKCFVPFRYEDAGIRCLRDGRRYPVMIMDWVPGVTLYDWVRAHCLKRNQKHLATSAKAWVQLIGRLNAARIAHGDLSHSNVMVSDKELKLVDYDCVCVPSLVGRANPEIGVGHYQHPLRDRDTLLTSGLHNFSTIVVFVALKALAADPKLWDRFVETPRCESLLFCREDFRAPDRSPLIQELTRSPDRDVPRLAQQVAELARGDLHGVPALAELVQDRSELSSYGGVLPGSPSRPAVGAARGAVTAIYAPAKPASEPVATGKPASSPMPKLFVSYRRDDAELAAHSICKKLRERFGVDSVFIDVDTIPPGIDFRKYLSDAVSKCDVLLAVIGDRWLDVRAGDGQRRLDDPRDFVRIEVQAALSRDVPVIPVLFGRVAMPGPRDLPEALEDLAYRNAVEVSSGRAFDDDVQRLIRGIERLFAAGS